MGYRSNYFDKNDAPKDLFGATKREVKSIIIIKTFL